MKPLRAFRRRRRRRRSWLKHRDHERVGIDRSLLLYTSVFDTVDRVPPIDRNAC